MMRNDEGDAINIKKSDKHKLLKNANKGMEDMEDITTSDELHRLITLLERDYKKKQLTAFPTILLCRLAEVLMQIPYTSIPSLFGLEYILIPILETINNKCIEDDTINRTDYHVGITVCYMLMISRYIHTKALNKIQELISNNNLPNLIVWSLKCISSQNDNEKDVLVECIEYIKNSGLRELDEISRKTLYLILINIFQRVEDVNAYINDVQEIINEIIIDIDDDKYKLPVIELLTVLSKIHNESIVKQILQITYTEISDPINASIFLQKSLAIIIKNSYDMLKEDIFKSYEWIIDYIIDLAAEYDLNFFLLIMTPLKGLIEYIASNNLEDYMEKIDLAEIINFADISRTDNNLHADEIASLNTFISATVKHLVNEEEKSCALVDTATNDNIRT